MEHSTSPGQRVPTICIKDDALQCAEASQVRPKFWATFRKKPVFFMARNFTLPLKHQTASSRLVGC